MNKVACETRQSTKSFLLKKNSFSSSLDSRIEKEHNSYKKILFFLLSINIDLRVFPVNSMIDNNDKMLVR
jgi:hypothetical protein